MNSTTCRPSVEFVAKSEASHDRLVRMRPSQKYRVGCFFQTILVKEAWTQSRTFHYMGVLSFPKAVPIVKSQGATLEMIGRTPRLYSAPTSSEGRKHAPLA